MKVVFFSLLFITILSGCTKEMSVENNSVAPGPAGNQTDTSVILTRKIIYYNGGVADSARSIYYNNTINGVKGYIVKDTSYATGSSSKFTFTYDSKKRLTGIDEARFENNRPLHAYYTVTWLGNEISNFKWIEDGAIYMNRNYDYQYAGDSMLIRVNYNIGKNIYLDSFSTVMVADTGWNKIKTIYETEVFDYTGLGTNTITGYEVSQKYFTYSGNNLLSLKLQGEAQINNSPLPYQYVDDTSTMTFLRQTQTNGFLNSMEKDFFGKELRLLSHLLNDSLYLIDNFFYYGDNSAYGSLYLDNTYANIYGAAYSPVSEARVTGVTWHNGILSDQKNNILRHKSAYTLDSQNRILDMKEYDAFSGQLILELVYTYAH